MDCNCNDYTYSIHVEGYTGSHEEHPSGKNRKLNEVAVELICSVNYEKDEAIQLQSIKVPYVRRTWK